MDHLQSLLGRGYQQAYWKGLKSENQWYIIKSYQLLALWLTTPVKVTAPNYAIQNPEVIDAFGYRLITTLCGCGCVC